MSLDKHHYFFLFVAFLFVGIVSVELFSDGMFMDGLWYACISRNMAEGSGTFWSPHFSKAYLNEFYQHPPLALGLQSVFFYIFGDSIFVERFYSLFTFGIVAYLMVQIWKELSGDAKSGWIPLFFWVIIGTVAWCAKNNMLENTMSIFVCASVLFYLKSQKDKRFLWIFLTGFSLTLGLLSKGFVCLYVWGLPFFYFLIKRRQNFIQMSLDTIGIIAFTILPLLILFYTVPEVQNNMSKYFEYQVLGSFENEVTVESRFAIVEKFIGAVMPSLLIALVIAAISFYKQKDKELLKSNLRIALVFMALTLAGVLPIMVSLKQRAFYILTVYPFISIALAYFVYPVIKDEIEKIDAASKGFRIFKIVTLLVILVSIGLSIAQVGRIGREKALIEDCRMIIAEVGEGATINICPSIYHFHSMKGYLMRYGHVSTQHNPEQLNKYYLFHSECKAEEYVKGYEELDLGLEGFGLYKVAN